MAVTFAAKTAGSVVERRWAVPVKVGDYLASATVTVSSGTAVVDSYEVDGNDIVVMLSGGTAGAYTILAASVVTQDGETLAETVYIPVITPDSQLANTGLDVCHFALRKIVGLGDEPDADELDDALERLNDMLAKWTGEGAATGVPLPVDSATVLYVPDGVLSAIKNNLILELADLYTFEPSPRVVQNAIRGLQQVKMGNLPADRASTEYY